jgi:hypothetical protein
LGIELPAVISEYFRADDVSDVDPVLACFTTEAEVVDDAARRRGHAEIREWRESLIVAFEYQVEVRSAREVGDGQYRLDTTTTGTFPGGTVDLVYDVTLRDGLIDRLVIAPAESPE